MTWMGVFAEIRNGFECFCKCNIFVFQIRVTNNCSISVFGNVRFNEVVRINHDNVATRGAVGRTHTIVRFQTRIRRKDGTENYGGFVYVLDGFPQRDFVLWVFMCLIKVILFCVSSLLSLFRLPRRRLPRPIYTARAITPLPPPHGYHACLYPGYHAIVLSYIPRLSHLSYHAPSHT